MLHPSYKELFQKINESREEGQPEMTSRYTLVLTAAKRSRQIRSGSEPLVSVKPKEKSLSTAVRELYAGKIHVTDENIN